MPMASMPCEPRSRQQRQRKDRPELEKLSRDLAKELETAKLQRSSDETRLVESYKQVAHFLAFFRCVGRVYISVTPLARRTGVWFRFCRRWVPRRPPWPTARDGDAALPLLRPASAQPTSRMIRGECEVSLSVG